LSSVIDDRVRLQFVWFRIALGAYLFCFFLVSIPYASEMYGREGMVPDPAVNYTRAIFPDPLASLDSPRAVHSILFIGALCCIPLCLGRWRQFVAAAIWLIFFALFLRNNFTRHVALDYVGWMLLFCVAVPAGEGRSPWSATTTGRATWKMPRALYVAAWAIAALGYSLSGWAKLGNPLWLDGSALSFILTGPLARDWVVTQMATELPLLLQLSTWGVLGAELLCLPMALWSRSRAVAWVALTGMHVGIALLLNLGEIPFALLLFHGLLFDVRWLPRSGPRAASR
jgi:hypothetical protein